MVLRPYPPNTRTEMYLLSISCELIRGRPISSTLVQKWKGDYLSDGSENPRHHVYNNAISQLKSKDNFNRVLFSSFIQKMNQHMKTQTRVIIITDKFLYRLDDKFQATKGKEPIKLNDILAARINNESEYQLIVLTFKNSEYDLVFYLDSKGNSKDIDRVPELLSNIYRTQIK